MTAQLDGYSIGKTLGSGFSAKVKYAQNQAGEERALKIFRKDGQFWDQRAFTLLQEEVRNTTQLDHKNVVKYHDFKESATYTKTDGT